MVAAGAAVACVVASVVAGSWRIVREPLIEQIDASHRPTPAAAVVLLGQTGVIVAAAIAVYQSTQHAGARDGWAAIADPSLLTPVLLGLAAGQAAVWLVRGFGAAMTRPGRRDGGIAPFLAVSRLARRSDTAFGARVVIAAGVVAAVTASAGAVATAWQDESTRIAMGGPIRYTVDPGAALAAYETTHQVDPDGRWLMAMVSAPDESETYRRVFADMDRWDNVVGDFFAGTGAGSMGRGRATLETGATVASMDGDAVTATFNTASLATNRHVEVSVYYATPRGGVATVILRPPDNPPSTGRVEVTAKVRPACADGCVVNQIVIDGFHIRPFHVLVISSLRFGDHSLLDQGTWQVETPVRHAQQTAHGLRVSLTYYGDSVTVSATRGRSSRQRALHPRPVGQPGGHQASDTPSTGPSAP